MTDHPSMTSSPKTTSRISRWHQTLPQVIVTSANFLLYLSLGMLIGYPTVLIPALTDETLEGQPRFTADEASSYVSLCYIFQPVGSIVAGAWLQSLGCKRLMILFNISQFGCWLVVYFATSNVTLYITHAVVGCVLGLVEGPGLRYVVEISHPSVRGVLTTLETLFISLGFLFVCFLGSLIHWREVALISSSVPILCTMIQFQIPETPMWLMSKGRSEDALHSLQWLRGWTSPEMVQDEFAKLAFYSKRRTFRILYSISKSVDTQDEGANGVDSRNSNGNVARNGQFRVNLTLDTGSDVNDPNVPEAKMPRISFQVEEGYVKRGCAEKWQDLTRREMLVPLSKCCALLAVFSFGGMPPLRPYLIKISERLNLPVQANWSSVLVALLGILGNVACMLAIKRVGKKPLLIFSLTFSAFCLVSLSLFLMGCAPVAEDSPIGRCWPLTLLLALFFFYNLGLRPIARLYLGEILPYRGRGVATSIAISFYYLVTFVAVKTFATQAENLGLHGIFLLYATVCVGGIFFTNLLPETEGRFLSDIETEIAGLGQAPEQHRTGTASHQKYTDDWNSR